jgi:hypothetical protein
MSPIAFAVVVSLGAICLALYAAERAERASRMAQRERTRGRLRALAAVASEVQFAADAYVAAMATRAWEGASESQDRTVRIAAAEYRRACRSLDARSKSTGCPRGGRPWLQLLIDEHRPEMVAETRAGEGFVSVLSRVADDLGRHSGDHAGSFVWRWLAMVRLARLGARGLLNRPYST